MIYTTARDKNLAELKAAIKGGTWEPFPRELFAGAGIIVKTRNYRVREDETATYVSTDDARRVSSLSGSSRPSSRMSSTAPASTTSMAPSGMPPTRRGRRVPPRMTFWSPWWPGPRGSWTSSAVRHTSPTAPT